MVVVGLSGPLADASLGFALWCVMPGSGLHFWFIGHLVFVLPLFGDGRAIVSGARRWAETGVVGPSASTRL